MQRRRGDATQERGRDEGRPDDHSQRDKKLGPRLFDRALVAAVQNKRGSGEVEERHADRKRPRR